MLSYRTLGAVYYGLSIAAAMGTGWACRVGDGGVACYFGCLGCILFGVGEWYFNKAQSEDSKK